MVNFQWESDWTNEDFIRIDIISGEEILEDANKGFFLGYYSIITK